VPDPAPPRAGTDRTPPAHELQKQIKQRAPFRSLEAEAFLNVVRTSAALTGAFAEMLRPFELTQPQYNVLRILRGVHPAGHPRAEISARLLASAPDVTRLVDRLQGRGLVERDRVEQDRRLSITRITKKGLRLLDEMQPRISAEHERFSRTVSRRDCLELSRICESIYDEAGDTPAEEPT
jgi:DNA-binding MarR family transcriptional regulator